MQVDDCLIQMLGMCYCMYEFRIISLDCECKTLLHFSGYEETACVFCVWFCVHMEVLG